MEEREFDRLVAICRLKLSAKEREDIRKDIDDIISYFDEVSKVDTGREKEAYHPVEMQEKLREDKVVPFGNVQGLLSNTKTYRFYVVGPKV
ncbi:MAG: Asp-tRNA(Asn)/Glu-tRNA(Gln) amidotransferase subunit GatC [Candidatus Micrarchaeota archaeon]|nr:Asp-tRNA(Asn)/Glu-tRNA(Gln) amidotransferase subunit GatC [Candidatus Micrarchaeota archaeon]